MQAADTTLQNNINAEASARAGAEAMLQNNINAEASVRIAADANLQSQIDGYSSGIAALNGALYGNSVQFGQGSIATMNAVAIGMGQTANGNGAVAIGDPNSATGSGAVAIGADNTAVGNGAVALGNMSSATGTGSVAIGNSAISGADGVALGNGATNGGFSNSVALGAGSTNTSNNQVAVGGRTVTGVAAGALTAASTDAVNGAQLYTMNQEMAANTAAIAAMNSSWSALQTDIGTLYDLRKQDRRDMRQGVASAVAIANAPMPSQPGRTSYAVNGATFRGEYAVGGSVNYRLNTSSPMAVGFGFSYAGNKNNSARIGVSGEF
jgi:autotransporter adhesin